MNIPFQETIRNRPNVPKGCGLRKPLFKAIRIDKGISGYQAEYNPNTYQAYDFDNALERGTFDNFSTKKIKDPEERDLTIYKMANPRVLNYVNYLLCNKCPCRTCPINGEGGCEPIVTFDREASKLTIFPEIPKYLQKPRR